MLHFKAENLQMLPPLAIASLARPALSTANAFFRLTTEYVTIFPTEMIASSPHPKFEMSFCKSSLIL